MKNKFFFFLCFLINFFQINAQDIIVLGEVRNEEKLVLANISIVVYINNSVDSYSYTSEDGVYSIKIANVKDIDTLKITANGLGYKSETGNIIYNGQRKIVYDFILEEKLEILDEVVLKPWEKIKVNSDTITYRVSKFKRGSEQVVEDLLKNLPGVEVLKNGSIKVNGKYIDKLLIEGDDLFDEKYKLLSKNLDANNISEVQIINNFEDNPILKSFYQSEKVALNLLLKENKKNVWFGNLSVGFGNDEQHEGSANIGLLKKKIKFFNLTNLNNTKKIAASQVNNNTVEVSNFQNEKKIENRNNTIADLDNLTDSNFSKNEDVFNKSFLNSLSFVTSLSQDTKLRSLSYYTFDKINKQNSNYVQYFSLPETINYTEENNISNKDIIFATNLELKHYKNKTFIKYDFSFENIPSIKKGNLILNENRIVQEQDDKKHNFYNHLNITKKLSDRSLLMIYAYYGKNNTNQKILIKPNTFNEQLGSEDPESFSQQYSNSPSKYTGIISELTSKIKKSQFSLETLASFDFDKINSNFSFDNEVIIDSISNNTDFKKTIISATGKYTYNFSDEFKLRSSFGISQNYTNLNNKNENFFFVNPVIGLTYKKKLGATLSLTYSFTNNLPKISYLNENFILKNYRTFSKGLEGLYPQQNHTVSLRYFYKNYKSLFLVNSYLFYSFSNLNYGVKSFINETSNYNQFKVLDGGNLVNFNFGLTRYLNKLPVSINLSTQHVLSQNDIILNNDFGRLKNYSSSYQLQANTYLSIPLNFNFNFQYNYSQGELNNQKKVNDYLEATLGSFLELSKKCSIQLNNDFYFINANNYLFTDLSIDFNPIESRWSYRLTGSNLLNTQYFSNTYISEYQTRNSSFKIVPRYFLIHLKYRF